MSTSGYLIIIIPSAVAIAALSALGIKTYHDKRRRKYPPKRG